MTTERNTDYTDESLDTGMAGRTELRIHGVSGTPPEAILDHPLLKQVAGDDKAGFHRRWYPGGRSADITSGHRLEAYHWGNLTSGSAARAAWLMLLPFMLANLAHWMLPPVRAEARRARAAAGHAAAMLLRLFGLALTFTLVLTAVQAAMDVAAWQCAGNWRCGSSSPLTTMLVDGWMSEPGTRIVISALVPLAVVGGIAVLGRKPLRRTSPEPDVSVAREGDRPLSRRSFWRGNPGMPALRSAHVAGSAALLAATIAWPATTLAASGAMAIAGAVVCVTSLAVVGVAAGLVATEGIAGRSAYRSTAVAATRRLAFVLLVSATIFSVWDHGRWEAAGRLPGLRPAILILFGAGFVLLLLLTAAVLVQQPWRHDTGGFRPTMRGLGTPAVATIAYLIAGGLSAGLAYRVSDLLGFPVLSQSSADALRGATNRIIADESLPFATRQAAWTSDWPIVIPPSFAWAGAAAAVIVAAVLLIAAWIGVGMFRRVGPLAEQIAAEHNSALTRRSDNGANTPPSSTVRREASDPEIRRIARVVAAASLTEGSGRFVGRVVLVAGAVLVAGLGVYAAGVDNWRLVEEPPLSSLTAFGTWLVGAFALGLVALVWRSVHSPALRRVVGILWDVGSFWPRAAHPLAPPSYGERAVPDLVDRVKELAAAPGSSVLLSGHSQGSVLAAATVMQLPEEVAGRVDLITHGSPLRRLYCRHFPAYLDRSALHSVAGTVNYGWKNFYRDTDPIGSWVFRPDDGPPDDAHAPADRIGDIDHRLLDPPTLDDPIAGHADYWHDTAYASHVRSRH
ncbi:hypothetical protein [Phytoactinopolyspora mesophila]|uniref:Integral membrane protein n=1 Tax=Phytoactinopolyspora mesophila TaxID=2650750 RepID=A0A7K3M475_9ACTN|nr:hypothetical protein [Phytoactinopolyspora mesophila]NDL57712.1 hypothetical protein [Phytoactinopolyspora mesophila]